MPGVAVGFLKWVGAWLGLGSAIYVLFDRAEKVVQPEVKRRISLWLQNVDSRGAGANWPGDFADVFDPLFGDNYLSWVRVRRSCVASLTATVVAALVVNWKAGPGLYEAIVGAPFASLLWSTVPLVALFSNLVGDYLSIGQSRVVVGWMGKKPSNYAWLGGMLLVDVALTAVIWTAMFVAAGALALEPLVGISLDYRAILLLAVEALLVVVGVSELDTDLAPWFVLLASTYFASFWIWLYLLSASILKAGVRPLRAVFDIKEQPLRSIGYASNLVITAVFLALLAWELVAA